MYGIPVLKVAPCRIVLCPEQVFEQDFGCKLPEFRAGEDNLSKMSWLFYALKDGYPDICRNCLEKEHIVQREKIHRKH